MSQNHNIILKSALLSLALVTASVNAIAGNIPDIAKSFPNVPLYVIELMTTLPSLTMMLAILCSSSMSQRWGAKHILLFGTLLCAISGTMPFFFQNIIIMLLSRAFFGFGVGCLSAMLLNLILYFFSGQVKSQMIGLQGSIGGLGSLLTTFIAGQLLIFGWETSFLTYLIAFVVFIIVLIFVPHVQDIKTPIQDEQHHVCWKMIFFYSFLSFVSVLLATFFVIKCSTLVTENQYGQVQDGSTLIMLISAGSLLAGAMYGSIYHKIKNQSLIVFYALCAVAFFIGGLSHALLLTMFAAFLLGYGYMAFVPFLQEKVGSQGHQGTRTLLVFQSLGSFMAPYLGTFLNMFTQSLNQQFMIIGCLYGLLTLAAIMIDKNTPLKK